MAEPTLVVIADDGETRLVHLIDDAGRVLCESIEPSPDSASAKRAAAEDALLDARRDVLRQQLDPKRVDPSPKAFADAQAFVALAADVGIAAAAEVSGDVLADALPADPKGGARA